MFWDISLPMHPASYCADWACWRQHLLPRNGSIRLDLEETSGTTLGFIPVGYGTMELYLASASSNNMHLQLEDASGVCLVGRSGGCLTNASCANSSDFCHEIDGVPMSYVSEAFLTAGGSWRFVWRVTKQLGSDDTARADARSNQGLELPSDSLIQDLVGMN